MRLPDRNELLDYAEQAAGQDIEVQKRILQLLASSALVRENLAELKRDLYVVSAQVPDYAPAPSFGPELMRLSQAWQQLVLKRRISAKKFYRSREFFTLMLLLASLLLLLVLLFGYQLMRT